MSQSLPMSSKSAVSAVIALLAAVILPIATLSVYLFTSRHWIGGFTGLGDRVAMCVAVLLGAACMYEWARNTEWFRGSVSRRCIAVGSYVVVAPGLLFFYSLYFVCIAFGDCL